MSERCEASVNMYSLIMKKRRGGELCADEIAFIVGGYVSGEIPDYQMSAFLMAVCFTSMTARETADLTMTMARSGDMFDLGELGFCVDKHSTGGVGDKATLVCAPVAAACGVPVPKMSGRGLGHTGGTIDKLESIPGFNTELTFEEFIQTVKKTGFAVTGQTGSLVPADKKIYALRDSTATVDSIPLICSSIMSKKLAMGASGIVLDVKVGGGAFMKNREDAQKLAEAMLETGRAAGKKCAAVITDMDKPLGRAVGNAIEVVEAIETLKGRGPDDLTEVSLAIAAQMLFIAGKGGEKDCMRLAEKALRSGAALEVLRETIRLQGGNPAVTDDYSLLPYAKYERTVCSDDDGYIISIDCEKTGLAALEAGAGRKRKGDEIDHGAGVCFMKTVGDAVCKGEPLAKIYTSRPDVDLEAAAENFKDIFGINNELIRENKNNILNIIKGLDI